MRRVATAFFPLVRSAPALTLLAAIVLAPPAPGSEPAPFRGRPLIEALQELNARGLQLVFTSSVVRPEMRVEVEPVAGSDRELLDQLLAPHGLVAQDGPGGTIVIVARAGATGAESSVSGFVRSRADGSGVAGATVLVIETGGEASTGADGGFTVELPPTGLFTLEARRSGFVLGQVGGVGLGAEGSRQVVIVLDPAPVMKEELLVTPSRVSILREQPVAQLDFSRDDIHALPHLGGDVFRALSLLPGIAANDVTARFHVRGGRRDETQVLLDGQELYEVYHLQDFDSALSVIAPTALENVDLITGGFPAEHGDRMSGVLDMTTIKPTGEARGLVGIGLLSVQLGGAGTFGVDEAGSWIVQARRGSIDLASKLLGKEDPRYWDAFAKLDYRFGPRTSLRSNLLHADDLLSFQELVGGESKTIETDYQNSYLWLTEQSILRSDLYVENALSASRIDRDRLGIELEEDVQFTIHDQRRLDILAARQNWTFQPSPKHFLKWGFEARRFDTEYDYFGFSRFTNPLAEIRERGQADDTLFVRRFKEHHYSAHLADRMKLLEALTLEVGLRYDEHTQTNESLLSPRFNLAYSAGSKSLFRLAWGRFTQSQRPYELQVEDGETSFFPVERSEHRVLGFERIFGDPARGGELVFRAELYRRNVTNPRPRFENMYEPINTFPEVEPDRIRIAPERSIAEGLELFLKGRLGRSARWWVNYTLSSTDDVIGGVRVPRRFDQTHSLNLDLDYRLGDHWRFNFAWRYHTGWPTTALSLRAGLDDDGEVVFRPVLGPLYGERLPDYHRLDLRAGRSWETRLGRLGFYVDLQNVYDRGNVGGFDFEIDAEAGTVLRRPEEWAGFLPSLGVLLEF